MLAYNHEAFIEKAVKSVLSQKTNFQYELLISNDCSTDNTDQIISAILNEHPHASRIRYINHQKNIGMMPNYISALKSCEGMFIATCDGDDYWIDDNKLQMQVDFLEQNAKYNIVYTLNKICLGGEKLIENPIKPINNRPANLDDLIEGNFIPASSVLFRNSIKNISFPSWIYNSPYGDWPLYMFLTREGGLIKCLAVQTMVYRKNVGVISKMKQEKTSILESNYYVLSHVIKEEGFKKHRTNLETQLYNIDVSLLKSFNRNRAYKLAYAKFKAIKKYAIHKKLKSKSLFKVIIKSFLEGLFQSKNHGY